MLAKYESSVIFRNLRRKGGISFNKPFKGGNQGNCIMHAGENEEASGAVRQPSGPSAVQGLPWWGGAGQQTLGASSSMKSLFVESPSGLSTGIRPRGFTRPHAMQQAPPKAMGQIAAGSQDPPAVATRVQNLHQCGFEMVGDGEHQQPDVKMALPLAMGEYTFPHTQLELGHSMTQVAYPYVDPYFGGIIAAYGAQTMIHPHMLGVQQARMRLPSEMVEEEPVYVNPKQYHGILRRRQVRAKAESENKLVRGRKPYLHESRHLHAMRRVRGSGGRFLNTKNKDDSKAHTDGSNNSSDGHSSHVGSTASSKARQMEHGLMLPQGQGGLAVQGMSGQVLGGIGQANAGGAGYYQGVLCHNGHLVIPSDTVQGSFYGSHQSQAFHPLPGSSDGDESGQNRGVMSDGYQQRSVATL